MNETKLGAFLDTGVGLLYEDDPLLAGLLEKELQRQSEVLTLVAASSVVDPSVLACLASVASNVTAVARNMRTTRSNTVRTSSHTLPNRTKTRAVTASSSV